MNIIQVHGESWEFEFEMKFDQLQIQIENGGKGRWLLSDKNIK